MSETRDTRHEKGGSSRWLWLALILSLSVNMLILGAIGTMAWLHFRGGPEGFGWMERMHERRFGQSTDRQAAQRRFARLKLARPGLLTASMRWLMRELPEERRRELRPVLRRHRQPVAKALADVAEARRQMLELVRQEPLNDAALQEAIDTLHKAELRARRHILEMIGEFVEKLSPRERQRFAEIVQRKAGRRHLLRR